MMSQQAGHSRGNRNYANQYYYGSLRWKGKSACSQSQTSTDTSDSAPCGSEDSWGDCEPKGKEWPVNESNSNWMVPMTQMQRLPTSQGHQQNSYYRMSHQVGNKLHYSRSVTTQSSHSKQQKAKGRAPAAGWFPDCNYMNVVTPEVFAGGDARQKSNWRPTQIGPKEEPENDYDSLKAAARAVFTKGLGYKNAARQFNVTVAALRHFCDTSSGDLWDEE